MAKILPNWFIALLFLPPLVMSSGCATTGRSVGAGSVAGGVMGAGIGAIADPGPGGENRIRNVLIGTAAGSLVGAGAGFMIDRHIKDERQESYSKGKRDAEEASSRKASSSSGNQPRLSPAQTEAKWVPDQVRGSTFIPGHFEYVIIEGAHWEASQ